jgi:putative ABC transport system ATP-binding protein
MIRINDLTFCYDEVFSLVVDSFFVERGEMVFLSGESGSGKSTLLNIIAGILNYKSGSVKVIGQELNNLTNFQRDRFRGENIGFIFQQFNLISYLSVRDNILLPCKFFNKECSLFEFLLDKLEISQKYWDKRVDELSIGQQQRVASVRALVGCPPIIIADEPTSALDTNLQDSFLKLLIESCKSINSSLLFVSHNEGLMNRFDKVVKIKDGIL